MPDFRVDVETAEERDRDDRDRVEYLVFLIFAAELSVTKAGTS